MDNNWNLFPGYPQHMVYSTTPPGDVSGSRSTALEPEHQVRHNAKWGDKEHQVFLATCELGLAEGHQSGKCFTKEGCDRIQLMFNKNANKNWNQTQLKNRWSHMRTQHKLLFQLLGSTGVGVDMNHGFRIIMDEEWWERKINENPKYAKFKDWDCGEIYTRYNRLFRDSYDYSQYAATPNKLSRRGFVINQDSDGDPIVDRLPVQVEGSGSSDESGVGKCTDGMDGSGRKSWEKCKSSNRKDKGKKVKYGARALSSSVERLARLGEELSSLRSKKSDQAITVDKCVEELEGMGKIDKESELWLFALSFLGVQGNRDIFMAAKDENTKLRWLNWSYQNLLQTRSGFSQQPGL